MMYAMGKLHNKKVDFIEHLEPLLNYYLSTNNHTITDLFRDSGIEPKRKSDFEKGRKTFTAYYFIKLLGGAGLSTENYELKTGKRFNKEQREDLAYQKFCDNNGCLLKRAMKDPRLLKQVKAIIESWES